jgi:hypothetical protein
MQLGQSIAAPWKIFAASRSAPLDRQEQNDIREDLSHGRWHDDLPNENVTRMIQ